MSSNGNGAGPHGNGVAPPPTGLHINGVDAMPRPPTSGPHWWLGYLAANIREALAEPAGQARSRLREALRRFAESPVCGDELRDVLGAKRRPATAPLNDNYDIGADWKPCGNPECRMPIPRSSPKLWCDQLCRHIAEEYAAETNGRSWQDDDIPF